MSFRRRRQREQVARHLRDQHEDRADVTIERYVSPEGRIGIHRTTPGRGSTVAYVAGNERTFAPGTHVPVARRQGSQEGTIIGQPPVGRQGTGRTPPETREAELDDVGITAMDPEEVPAGEATAVTLTGFGLRESPVDTLECVVAGDDGAESLDPLLSLGTIAWVSATEVTTTITVDASAPVGYPVSIRARRA